VLYPVGPTGSTTLVDLLRFRAATHPERLAFRFLVDDERSDTLTYADLELRARGIAAALQRRGLGGERVLLVFPPGLDFVAAFFGCLMARAVAVPVNPPRLNRRAERVDAIVADSAARAVLGPARGASALRGLAGVPGAEEMTWLFTAEIPDDLADEWREADVAPDALALLQYTSGSTAVPRGVMLTHANILANLAAIDCWTGVAGREPYGVFWLPHFHDMGLMGGILQHIYWGGSTSLLSPAAFVSEPLRWLREISRTRATHVAAPNFAYDHCVRQTTEEERRSLDLSSLVVAFNGGEPVRHATLERFAEAFAPSGFRPEAMYPCYGLAESTLIVTGKRRGEPSATIVVDAAEIERDRVVRSRGGEAGARTLVSCGRAADGHAVVVVDPGTCVPCEAGRVGEIWVTGPSVASGYWGCETETVGTFHAHLSGGDERSFLRTGDLGFLDDGELYVTGRLKDLIIVRGRNLYPNDVESAAAECHPRLRAGIGAAFSASDGVEERLVVLHEADRRLKGREAEVVLDALRTGIADEFEVAPYAVALLPPGGVLRTSSGKVRRRACREAFLDGSLRTLAEWRAPVTNDAPTEPVHPVDAPEDIEEWLVRHVAERFGLDPADVDVHLPFAYYGVDSVESVALGRALAERTGLDIPETFFWDYPTIEAVVRRLATFQ
jgi:acyl-CoA synthetase (AMP-forming)/AMP-acid ligase II/acyl carrier protein